MSDKPSLAEILGAVMQPGASAPAPSTESPLALMMAMMQQQNEIAREQARAAEARAEKEEQRRREEKAETTKMLMSLGALILPKLLDKPAMDPFMVKMLESSSNKEAMQQFLATSSALNQQSSQMFMQQLATMMGTMGDMQNRMTERQIDMMEERMAKMASREDDDEEKSPFADIVKAVMPILLGEKAPIGTAVVNAVTAATPAAPAVPIASGVPAVVAPPAVELSPAVKRKVKLMKLCMVLHLRGSTFAPEKVTEFKQAIIGNVVRLDDVARSIMEDDSGALMTALAPAVAAEAPLGTWVQSPAAQTFIGELIASTVKPGIVAVAQEMQRRAAVAQAPAAAVAPPAEPETLGPEHVA